MQTTNEPQFVKYPKIHYYPQGIINNLIYDVYEKIDGGNCQLRQSRGRVFPGNRSKSLTNSIWDNEQKLHPEKRWMARFKKWAMRNKANYSIPEDFIFFGEWTTPMKVSYPAEMRDRFFLLDTVRVSRDGETMTVLPYQMGIEVAKNFGLDFQYLKKIGEVKNPKTKELDAFFDVSCDIPKLANSTMEGVVLKNYHPKFSVSKHLYDAYSEHPNTNAGETMLLLNPNRLFKAYHRLLERPVVMAPTPGELVEEVIRDIQEETGKMVGKAETVKAVNKHFIIGKRKNRFNS